MDALALSVGGLVAEAGGFGGGKTPHGGVKHDRVPAKGRSKAGGSLTESICMYQKDRELLLAIMDYYGCSKAEAFRTIVRAHAIQIGVQ